MVPGLAPVSRPEIKFLKMQVEELSNPRRSHAKARAYLEAFIRENAGAGDVVSSAWYKGGL